MRIIIGLGNPGKDYTHTRHNVGFLALDYIQEHDHFPAFTLDRKMKAELTSTIIRSTNTILAKPQTYMNRSGEAVLALKQFYKCNWSDILIIYDDIDIPFGTTRFREKGSAGTHNGMRSIIQLCGTEDIPRLRIGIKPEHPIQDLSNFVLGGFTKEELQEIQKLLQNNNIF